ncbi:hypothetical protein KC340_g3799 [Hortaea werneckii]|nr:hypothetical protein KC342_g4056 [Hortaea werneckii]KAI7102355.1 hypothetical protein KC339_g6079 [Hortaea werneckii]KAI7240237.1 hypothetical protein KC365_g3892 [Hortaea werneckii]KAI7331498.1 hypothetical protein KC340_g3799 [Hortaea werneckii]KAI7401299.1 hypothetical protein KC328_g3220 [Hortaea werneckii]
MRIFTAAVAALLAVLSVTVAQGEDGSVHSFAIPASQGQSSGYCCLESGENTKCVELGASICASPFTPAAGFISQGTGEVVTLPTATSTLRMEGLGPVLTQSARIKDRSSTSQRSTVSQDDALGKGGSAPSVTSSGPGGQPIETFATASILTEPTCDDGGCCTFPPSWTARQGGYLTKMNEDILTSTQTPSSEPSGEKLFQTILGLDDSKHATWMFSTSTSKNRAGETFVVVQPVVILNQKAGTDRERLDFSTMTSIRPFPTPSHYRISLDDTCGDDKDHCAPEKCNPSVLYGRCWSPAWNTSTNDNSDHRRRDDLTTSNSSTTAATVHETSVVDVSNASTSSTGESSKSIARGTSDVPTSSMEMSAVDHSHTHDGVSIHTIVDATVTEVVTASEESSNNLLASMSTSTSTTTITNNITLTNPLNPAATNVVPADYTRQNISNTSINTEIFVNISTFSATGLTISSTEVSTTEADSTLETGLGNSETSISSKVIRPSATETQPFNNGPQDFSPAATTNIGGQNHSSEGVKTTGGDGAFYMIAAVLGLAEIGGLMLLM